MRRVLVPWLSAAALLSAAFAASTCGSGETAAGTSGDTCPSGLCGTNSTSGNGGSGGSSSSSSSGAGGTGGSTTCIESWSCSPWQTDGASDAATRTCTDANKCGSTANKPIEAATLPKLDLDYYKCKVEPIFDRGCAHMGCHGTETGRALRVYARGRLRNKGELLPEIDCLKPPGTMVPTDQCIGSIECACFTATHTATEWQKNFDAARGFGIDAQGAPIPAGMEDASELIAQPIVGGKSHAGVHLFKSGDPEHTTLKAWLSGATLGMICNTTN